jgi:hypothetical protein
MTSSAFFLWTLGFPERADLRGQRAIAAARDLRHPYSLAYALYHVAFIDLWNLNIEGVARNAAELHTVATTYGYSIWEALAIVLEGFVEVVSGEHEAGLSTIEHGIGLYESASAPPVFWGLIMNLRAAACLAGGQPEAAERFVNTALEFTPETSGMLTAAAVTRPMCWSLWAPSTTRSAGMSVPSRRPPKWEPCSHNSPLRPASSRRRRLVNASRRWGRSMPPSPKATDIRF